ncbi:glycoside hydrolase family 2 protein [Kockovaella imperatae]|uniref:Beta-mannosidase B n=1 Tax=Kockovaella imperatae TaxID=4999 RepID=A0A1Y1UCB5_9TREE|nr:glycoside hydrolase family 2 protein [Kockovaella imperatae]ORX35177.1 glycoside hydrolase family 2 protein [Kockovaella imperatae]
MVNTTQIKDGWSFTKVPEHGTNEKEEWIKCSVPTDVHTELIKAKKIKHPYKDLNEWDVQWIPLADWQFKTTFKVTDSQLSEQCVDLVFEGLDTYCDITVNGRKVGSTDNMFIGHRFAVKDLLKAGNNELVLDFESPKRAALREEHDNGGPMTFSNGFSERIYSRKAQYHWGWDWGPTIICVGPWLPVSLESYSYRIADVHISSDLEGPDFKTATLKATTKLADDSAPLNGHKLVYTLKERDGHKVVEQATLGVDEKVDWKFGKGEIEGWYPRNYGAQTLYELETALIDRTGNAVASKTSRVAFRHAVVVQDPLEGQEGTSFLFEVNGIRIFCGGSNWIPADNFLTQISPERYRAWIELMVKGNQNMLRVWGGGIYESQALYSACDELGVLVWQDFMFGCALYPSYPKINASIKREAESVVTRLRDHPSVVIFAGNNEDYQVAESEGVMDYNDNSGDYMHSKFPARHIYEILLPEVVERLSNIHYHRSSPYGGKNTTDPTVGDIHQWNVWHGTQNPWTEWDILSGRFVSEFGMQGYPDIRTVQEWTDDKSQLFPQSRIAVQHNKATGFERRLELYLMENYRHAFDMESYVYYTQVMQAECISAAYRLWRREWRGHGREYVAGALVWQLNDCWPCVSWAICDYNLRPKPCFFAVARELATYTVGIARKMVHDNPGGKDPFASGKIHEEIQLWGCNSSLKPKRATLRLVSFDLQGGEVDSRDIKVDLAPNSSIEIWKGDVPGQVVRRNEGSAPKAIVVQARLIDDKGAVLARYSSWPEPFKYLTFPDPSLKIQIKGDEVTLSCSKPMKSLVFDVESGDECHWSDQTIDLFPGDPQVITAKGLNGRKIKVRHLGDGSA